MMLSSKRGPINVAAALVLTVFGLALDVGLEQIEARGTKPTAGDLVESFGEKGRKLDDLSGGKRDQSYSVAVQPDGKILVGGWSVARDGAGKMAVARYRRSGARDRTFGSNGVKVIGRCFNAQAIEVLASGKILLAGSCDVDLGLVRLKPNGKLDASFGDRGVADADLGFGQGSARDLVLDSAGRITVAGETRDARDDRRYVAVARFLSNGELDDSFAGDGALYTTYGEDTYARAYGVDLQSDGKAVVVGEVGQSWILSRFTVDGHIDTSFGVDGVEYRGPVSVGVAHAVDVLPDDRILAAGTESDDQGFRMAAVRSLPDGETDTSFGDEGATRVAIRGVEDADEAWAMARDSRGRIVLAGYTRVGPEDQQGSDRFGIVRLRPRGALDRSFGGDGAVRTNLRPDADKRHHDLATAVALAPNDDPLVAGYSDRGPGKPKDFAVARYRGHGTR